MALKITRPERTVQLCTDAALRADWEAAEAALIDARKESVRDRLTGNADVTRLAEEVRRLEDAMRESIVHFRLRALPRSKWAELIAANPPAEDASEADKRFGANMVAFFDAAIPASIVAVTDHAGELVEFDPDTEWDGLADEMTDKQHSDFVDAVFVLNRGTVDVPFSRAASVRPPASSEN